MQTNNESPKTLDFKCKDPDLESLLNGTVSILENQCAHDMMTLWLEDLKTVEAKLVLANRLIERLGIQDLENADVEVFNQNASDFMLDVIKDYNRQLEAAERSAQSVVAYRTDAARYAQVLLDAYNSDPSHRGRPFDEFVAWANAQYDKAIANAIAKKSTGAHCA